MKTAVDTNVLLYVARAHPTYLEPALTRLEESLTEGSVVICASVYAELAVNFEQGQEDLDAYLTGLGIGIDPYTPETLFRAGEVWREYRRTRGPDVQCPHCGESFVSTCPRCGTTVSWRQRVLPDFLVGAHALLQADALLTHDRGTYHAYFPNLSLLSI